MRAKGFGTEFPELSASPGQAGHESDPVKLLQQMTESLDRLADDLALPPLRQATILNMAASEVKVIDTRGQMWRQLIVNVIAGTCDVWLGEGASPQSGTIPQLRFTPGGQPFVLTLPPNSSSVTVFAAAGAALQGSVILTS